MRRLLPRWLYPAALLAAGLTAWLVVTVGSLADGGRELGLTARLTPSEVRFGDPVVARLWVPRGAHVDARFAPYHVRSMHRYGRAYVFKLECLSAACVSPGRVRELQFPPASVRVGSRTLSVSWPVLMIGSRLGAADLSQPRFRGDTHAPRPSFRIDPGLLGWSLSGVAAVLVLGTGAVGARRLRARPVLELAPEPDLSPLERAVIAVLQATARPVDERRTALDQLSLVVEDDELARHARRIAWSERPPEPGPMRELVSRVRKAA